MGLDMHMLRIPADFIRDQPATECKFDPDDLTEMKYWRKHGQLQNWMHRRYTTLGGKSKDFNCVYLRLFEHDFQNLINDLKNGNMPSGNGFFFGESSEEKNQEDLEYFTELLPTLNFKKWAYLYTSWY